MGYIENHQHRRYNPLTEEWVLVSPHRTQRPWHGDTVHPEQKSLPEYDHTCYLCPRNTRANGEHNPDYKEPFIFENDYAALQRDTPRFSYRNGALIHAESEYGLCKVVCYAPQHNLHIADFDIGHIQRIIAAWCSESATLRSDQRIKHIQIFENRGAAMGASNPHPHGQIWANQSIPHIALRKATTQLRYWQSHKRKLLSDYLEQEHHIAERIIYQNQHFTWVVPFWAVWPYETIIIAKQSRAYLEELNDTEQEMLAEILKTAVATYDKLFATRFPYSMGVHLPPVSADYAQSWQLHIGFYPPLLRSAAVRKFMVGYELCAMPQRDITAEIAAAHLKKLCTP